MLPVSSLLWKIIPALPAIQFPWRFNTILTLATAVLLAFAVDTVRGPGSWSAWRVLLASGVACVALLWAGLAAKEILFRAPWNPPMTRPFADTLIAVWARWTDPVFLNRQGLARMNEQSTIREGLRGEISVERWSSREIRFTSNTQDDKWLIARRLYYPGWIATTETGRVLQVGPSPGTGLIQVKVPGGVNKVHVTLPWGWMEKLGMALTALCGLMASALLLSGLGEGFGRSTSRVPEAAKGTAA
jgi:hypothetical protein